MSLVRYVVSQQYYDAIKYGTAVVCGRCGLRIKRKRGWCYCPIHGQDWQGS